MVGLDFSIHNKEGSTLLKEMLIVSYATLYKINTNRTEMKCPQNANSHYTNTSYWIQLVSSLCGQLRMHAAYESRLASCTQKCKVVCN